MTSIRANARTIMCIGRNYAAHIAELNNATPSNPFFFLKPVSSIVTPGSGPVLKPKGVIAHYEVELGIVVDRKTRDIDAKDKKSVMDSIGGYFVGIDMTARNVQDAAKSKGLPWTIGKGFDTFLPISEFITKEQIPDPQNVELYLSVNDKMQQNDNTNLMLFDIPTIISTISKVMTLERGDLILTGTPKGVGPVEHGDVMKAGVKVDGKEIAEGRIEIAVEDRVGGYVFPPPPHIPGKL